MNDLPTITGANSANSSRQESRWSRLWRWLAGLLAAVLVIGGATYWRQSLISKRLENECRRLEAARDWSRLLATAQEWRRWEPHRREPLKAGVAACRALRQPASMAAFLRAWPKETAEDVPWLSMLAELQFDPLRQPAGGAATCREMIRLDPRDLSARQRLIFFDAVTMQPVSLLDDVRDAARSACDAPEFYVYAFLIDGLRLNNALDRLQKWMSTGRNDELLMVAYAMHSARNLEGSIPSVEEQHAAALRRSQEQRAGYLQQLRIMFPENHEVLAYDLEQAVQAGHSFIAAELLSRAKPLADRDHRFWRARGWLLMRAGNLEGAGEAFREARAIHPLDWRLRHYLADWERRRGNLSEAEAAQRLAARGRALESNLLAMPDVRSIPGETLRRMAVFATDCGATLYADRIRHHADARDSEPDSSGAGQHSPMRPESPP